MPGKRITKQQIRLYMESKQKGKVQKIAAAQAGFSERSARNIESRRYQSAHNQRDKAMICMCFATNFPN